MLSIYVIISVLAGFILGLITAYLFKINKVKDLKELADELYRETETQRKEERDTIIEILKANFGNLSLDVLSKSTDQFLKLAQEKFESARSTHTKDLEEKKGLINQQLENMKSELGKVTNLVSDFEKDRERKFGTLTKHLEETSRQTSELIKTTATLKEALSSSQTRGQWGERMAEDVLRLAGLVENINYVKQKTIKDSGNKPDFTFFMPQERTLNMDVKFPYSNYIGYLEAISDTDRELYRKQFLRDVKKHIQDLAERDYINTEQNTVDCVLLFIPNEQIYAFIQEQDASILDRGLRKKIIPCSPFTLFAVLAVIRKAVDNFMLEQRSEKILSLLWNVKNQWSKFIEGLEKLGRHIQASQKDYDTLMTTRRNQIEKPLREIETMKIEKNLPEAVQNDDIIDEF